jgi:uncharacterized membrane protein
MGRVVRMLNSLFDSFFPTQWYTIARLFRMWWFYSPASLIVVVVSLALLMVVFAVGYLGGRFAREQNSTPDSE